jgi:hypothetical protein
MNRVRVIGMLLIFTAGVVAACGVPSSSSFKRTSADKIPFDLAGTTTTSSTSTTTTTTVVTEASVAVATTFPPVLDVALYFVSGARMFRVTKPIFSPASLDKVLIELEAGPSIGARRTAIPAGAKSTATISRGIVTIDLPIDFFAGMTPQDQRFAIAQYVLTATEVTGVGQVTFTQGGSAVSVFDGNGEATDPGQTLAHEDYERLLEPGVPEVTVPPTTAPSETTDPTSTTIPG